MRYERTTDGRYIIDHTGRPPLGRDHAVDNWPTVTLRRFGKAFVRPEELEIFRCPLQLNGSRYVTGEYIRKQIIGRPCLTAHTHEFYMAHPYIVPKELRGDMIYSWGDIFDGYKGEEYVRCFYFVGGEIRESMSLVQGESWEVHQVAGILTGMLPVQKTW